jgi:ribose-phosphate pyrophosphokinase
VSDFPGNRMMANASLILSGTANPELAAGIARYLDLPIGTREIERFPDGETSVELQTPVRGKEVIIVQSTSPPVDSHLMELLVLSDACRRAAATRIIAVIPYFGYGRADKRILHRESITARLVADLLQAAGVQHVVTIDLHAPQIEGFFTIPMDSLTAVSILCGSLKNHLPKDIVTVSPDLGRIRMAAEYARLLDTPTVVLHKHRQSSTSTTVKQLVGDVRDRACLIVDDMIATGGTIAESINFLLAAGACPDIWIAATHGLFLDGAYAKLTHSAVREIWVTDTVAPIVRDWPQLKIASVAPLLAGALQQIHAEGAFTDLY